MTSHGDFFKALFSYVEAGSVNIRLLPSEKSYFISLDKIEQAKFPEDQNCYFTPATRNGGAKKEHIASTNHYPMN